MLLYDLDVQIKGSHHKFELTLGADDLADDEGTWSASSPAELYLGQIRGGWRLHSFWSGGTEYVTIHLLDGSNRFGYWGAFKYAVLGGGLFPEELAELGGRRTSGLLERDATGNGRTVLTRGSWGLTWKLDRRPF